MMKPKHLKSPFTNESELGVKIVDRVWYVPSTPTYTPDFTFEGWSSEHFFGNQNKIHVEYCSGNGEWIAEKARLNPHINWIAVEKKFMRVKKIWSKLKNNQLNNLIILCSEAHFATKLYFPSESIEAVYVNFPDPWPKKRHAKHRLIQDHFLMEVERILEKKGTLTLVTDDADYSQQMIATVQNFPIFHPNYPNPYYTTSNEDYGNSWFKELWSKEGREIRFISFQKN